MGRFDTIKTTIDANIKENGSQEITGQKMNSILTEMVNATDAEVTELESEIKPQQFELNVDANVAINDNSIFPVFIKKGEKYTIIIKDSLNVISKLSALYSCDSKGQNTKVLKYDIGVNMQYTYVAENDIDYIKFYNAPIEDALSLTIEISHEQYLNVLDKQEQIIADIYGNSHAIGVDLDNFELGNIDFKSTGFEFLESDVHVRTKKPIRLPKGTTISSNYAFSLGWHNSKAIYDKNEYTIYENGDYYIVIKNLYYAEIAYNVITITFNGRSKTLQQYINEIYHTSEKILHQTDIQNLEINSNNLDALSSVIQRWTIDGLSQMDLDLSIFMKDDVKVSLFLYSNDRNAVVEKIELTSAIKKFSTRGKDGVDSLEIQFRYAKLSDGSNKPITTENIISAIAWQSIILSPKVLFEKTKGTGGLKYFGDSKINLDITDNYYWCKSNRWYSETYGNGNVNNRANGMAIYNNRLFQFVDNLGIEQGVSIYDFTSKTLIQTASLPFHAHNNNAIFTNIFYVEDDIYPLILLSPGDYDGEDNGFYLIRVIESNNNFTFEIVNKIHCLIPMAKYNGSWVADFGTNRLWLYTMTNGSWEVTENNEMALIEVKMPDLLEENHYITEDDIIKTSRVGYAIAQSAVACGGKLWIPMSKIDYVNGVRAEFSTQIIAVINPDNGRIENIIPSGTYENEGICIYNKAVYVSSKTGTVTNPTSTIFVIDKLEFS